MPNRNALNALYLAKVEVTEGVDPTPDATNNVIALLQPIDPSLDYAFKQPRPRLVKGIDINAQAPLRPRGLIAQWSPSAWFRGVTTAPLVGAPIELDPWFQAAGYAATYSGGAGAEQVAYTLASSSLKTITDTYNEDGILYVRNGVRGELGLSLDVGGPLVVAFNSQGKVEIVSQVAVSASPVFKPTTPPTATDLTVFSISGYAAGIVRKFSYNTGNTVHRRDGMLATGGVAGFRIPERAATFSVVLEDPAISEFDFRNNMTTFADSVIHWTLPGNGTNYESFDFLANHAKIEKITSSNDSGLALITLEGGIYDVPQGTPVTLTVKK